LLSDLPVGSGSVAEARKAAGYRSKYVAKTFADEDAGHRLRVMHRFDVARGFKPAVTRLTATTADGVLARACDLMGSAPERTWNSAQVEDWRGAPAIWAQWTA
jgi:hypothetical protein